MNKNLLAIIFAMALIEPVSKAADSLAAWTDVQSKPVLALEGRHTIHSYFNTCPESPDGRYVVFYTSATPEGETGDLRLLERATGQARILVKGIHTEDAHRAACQQWSNGGTHVVFHDYRDGHWQVLAVDIATGKESLLALDHQVGFGAVNGPWVPIYGCHWKLGEFRDLELVNVVTGEKRVAVTVAQVLATYPDWTRETFGTDPLSIFFPVLSPDGNRVFFKLSRPGGGDNFKSGEASLREGKFIYDLEKQGFLGLQPSWGHPSWHPDSRHIFEKGNLLLDLATMKNTAYSPSTPSDHPSISPDGRLFVSDRDFTWQKGGHPGEWVIAVGSMEEDAFVFVDRFNNTHGATSWRRNHPHPVFSADGKRLYYNVNSGPWTTLMMAESH